MLRERLIFILRATCFCLFAGYAWQHLLWDVPLHLLLTEDLGFSKEMTQNMVVGMGWAYVGFAVLAVVMGRHWKKTSGWMVVASILLFLRAYLSFLDNDYQWLQFLEYAAQIMAPFILYTLLFKGNISRSLSLTRIAVALTFIGHGLYATGLIFEVPAHFLKMSSTILGLDLAATQTFLLVTGILNLIAVLLLFVPKIGRYAALYMFVWALLAALAHVVGNFDATALIASLDRWAFEFLIRIPQASLPLWIFVHAWTKARNKQA